MVGDEGGQGPSPAHAQWEGLLWGGHGPGIQTGVAGGRGALTRVPLWGTGGGEGCSQDRTRGPHLVPGSQNWWRDLHLRQVWASLGPEPRPPPLWPWAALTGHLLTAAEQALRPLPRCTAAGHVLRPAEGRRAGPHVCPLLPPRTSLPCSGQFEATVLCRGCTRTRSSLAEVGPQGGCVTSLLGLGTHVCLWAATCRAPRTLLRGVPRGHGSSSLGHKPGRGHAVSHGCTTVPPAAPPPCPGPSLGCPLLVTRPARAQGHLPVALVCGPCRLMPRSVSSGAHRPLSRLSRDVCLGPLSSVESGLLSPHY